MKLHQLRNFVAVAERGSLRAASRHLQLAQPALTRSLGELERELGMALFERHARGMTLTEPGRAFALRASAILNEVRRAKEEMDQLGGGTGGSVAAALSIAAHLALLPSALPAYRNSFPGVQLRLVEAIFPTVQAALRDGSIDFYLGPAPGAKLTSDLAQDVLFANTRIVVGRRNHPLAYAGSLAELADAEWATTSITLKASDELGLLFRRYRLGSPRLVLQSQSALTLIVTLASTDILAMVPVQWLAFPPVAGMLQPIPVREKLPAPDIVCVRRAGLPLTPAATGLLDLLRRAAGNRLILDLSTSRKP